jgi:hypothetical protein
MQWGLGFHDWSLIPDKPFAYEIMRQLRWLGQIVTEKIVGLVLLSITAFFASRTYHPTWKWGLATGVTVAVAYQIIAALVYILRFGMEVFKEYNNFFLSISVTVWRAWLFGYLAIRRQSLDEKSAV